MATNTYHTNTLKGANPTGQILESPIQWPHTDCTSTKTLHSSIHTLLNVAVVILQRDVEAASLVLRLEGRADQCGDTEADFRLDLTPLSFPLFVGALLSGLLLLAQLTSMGGIGMYAKQKSCVCVVLVAFQLLTFCFLRFAFCFIMTLCLFVSFLR